jgi:hypothetical protein
MRSLLSYATLALAAHGAAYRTFLPRDGVHGYFGWYEPLVGGLSLLALLYVVTAACRAASRPPCRVAAAGAASSLVRRVVSLACGGLTLLVLQETVERSVAEGRLAPGGFAPAAWVIVVAAALAAAFVLALLHRGYETLKLRLAAAARAAARVARSSRPPEPLRPRRRRPLADNSALRGPPAFAV